MANRLLDYEARPASDPAWGKADQPFDPTAPQRGDWTDWKNAVENYIAANPGIGLGAALLAGVLLGWLIKRR